MFRRLAFLRAFGVPNLAEIHCLRVLNPNKSGPADLDLERGIARLLAEGRRVLRLRQGHVRGCQDRFPDTKHAAPRAAY